MQADRSGAPGVSAGPVSQRAADGQGAPEAVRADEPEPAPEETVSQGTGPGRDAAGVGAPQPAGVSLPVQE